MEGGPYPGYEEITWFNTYSLTSKECQKRVNALLAEGWDLLWIGDSRNMNFVVGKPRTYTLPLDRSSLSTERIG